MNKTQLVKSISEKTGVTQDVAKQTLEATLDSIVEAVAGGDDVQLIGFGTFSKRERAARAGKNPQTGEAITIAASSSLAFKQAKAVKDLLNQ